MNRKSLIIARAGVVAALYASLTLAFAFSSFATATLQVRISEALTLLPLFFPETAIGLYIGCMLGNIAGGSIVDVFVGSLATLFAAGVGNLVRKMKPAPVKIAIAGIAVVVFNALIVPLTFTVFVGEPDLYFIEMGWVGLGETIAVGALAVPVAIYFERRNARKQKQVQQDTEEECAGADGNRVLKSV